MLYQYESRDATCRVVASRASRAESCSRETELEIKSIDRSSWQHFKFKVAGQMCSSKSSYSLGVGLGPA